MITVISNRRILNKATIGLMRIPHNITTKEVSIYLHTHTHRHSLSSPTLNGNRNSCTTQLIPMQSSCRILVAGCLGNGRELEAFRIISCKHLKYITTTCHSNNSKMTKTLQRFFFLHQWKFLFKHKFVGSVVYLFVCVYIFCIIIVPLGNSLLILCSQSVLLQLSLILSFFFILFSIVMIL